MAQTSTVIGVNAGLVNGSQATNIGLSVVDASFDDDFNGVNDQTVSATITDSDTAGFTVVESGGSSTVKELKSLPFGRINETSDALSNHFFVLRLL